MADNRFKKIDDLNESLENSLNLCINVLSNLDLEGKTQAYVDKKCIKISESINSKLDFLRSDIIINLHECYTEAEKQISQLGSIVNSNPTDLGGCIDLVKKIASLYAKPYQEALRYYVELMPRIQSLMSNIATIKTIPSYLPSIPNINFDKLQINMPPIGMSNVVDGNLDTPTEPPIEKPRRQINFRTLEDLYNQDKTLLKNGDSSIITYVTTGVKTDTGIRDLSDSFGLVTLVYKYNNGNFEYTPYKYPHFKTKNDFLEFYKNQPSVLKVSDKNTTYICGINNQIMSLEKIYYTTINKKLSISDVDFGECILREVEEKLFEPTYIEIS